MTSDEQLQEFHAPVSITQIWVVRLIGFAIRKIHFN